MALLSDLCASCLYCENIRKVCERRVIPMPATDAASLSAKFHRKEKQLAERNSLPTAPNSHCWFLSPSGRVSNRPTALSLVGLVFSIFIVVLFLSKSETSHISAATHAHMRLYNWRIWSLLLRASWCCFCCYPWNRVFLRPAPTPRRSFQLSTRCRQPSCPSITTTRRNTNSGVDQFPHPSGSAWAQL